MVQPLAPLYYITEDDIFKRFGYDIGDALIHGMLAVLFVLFTMAGWFTIWIKNRKY